MSSDHATVGSDSCSSNDENEEVTITCRKISGEEIGVCTVSRDATIGQLIARLKNILGKYDLRTWEPAHFVIGEQDFDFDNAYTRFMLTSSVKRALKSNPKGKLDCVIIMRLRRGQAPVGFEL